MLIKDKNNLTETALETKTAQLGFFSSKKSSTISHFHMCVCFW